MSPAAWHYHYAIGVGNDVVARTDARLADGDSSIHSLDLHSVLAGAHEASPGEHRVPTAEGLGHVPAYAIDHRTGEPACNSILSHDIAPDRAVGAAIVVDDDD